MAVGPWGGVFNATAGVRVASRSIPPRWGSIQFRLAPRTHVRPTGVHRTCGEPDETKKTTHPVNITSPSREQAEGATLVNIAPLYGDRCVGSRVHYGITALRTALCTEPARPDLRWMMAQTTQNSLNTRLIAYLPTAECRLFFGVETKETEIQSLCGNTWQIQRKSSANQGGTGCGGLFDFAIV